jgi:hypothetical protein
MKERRKSAGPLLHESFLKASEIFLCRKVLHTSVDKFVENEDSAAGKGTFINVFGHFAQFSCKHSVWKRKNGVKEIN